MLAAEAVLSRGRDSLVCRSLACPQAWESRFGWFLDRCFFAGGIGVWDGGGRFAASVDFAKESFGGVEQFGGGFGARAKEGDAGDGQNESGNHRDETQ